MLLQKKLLEGYFVSTKKMNEKLPRNIYCLPLVYNFEYMYLSLPVPKQCREKSIEYEIKISF